MAVVDLSASTIADEVEKEPWKNAGSVATGKFTTSGHLAVAANNDDGSTYRPVRIPSRARVVSIKLFCTAITGGTSYDVGLYLAGSTVKDADCYASAVDLSSALVGVEVAFEARALTAHRQKAWQDAGDSADPGGYYDLVLTANTVGTAAGTILVIVDYVLD